MEEQYLKQVTASAIGVVSRKSGQENERDRSLAASIIFDEALTPALDGIEQWSHIYVIFWLDKIEPKVKPVLRHPPAGPGIFAARSPIHPNPIGLTLVELIERKENILSVRGLDAYDGTPVLDIKPYPDWERELQVVTDFTIPEWLRRILEKGEEA